MALTTKQENQLLRILREFYIQEYLNQDDTAPDIFGFSRIIIAKKIVNGTDAQKVAIIDSYKTHLLSEMQRIETETSETVALLDAEKTKINNNEWE